MKPGTLRLLTSAILSLIPCILLMAQPPGIAYQQAGNREDYASLSTYLVFQDSRGLIWIGTTRGLERWDGSRLHSYPYLPFDSTAIPAQRICDITEDDQNNLWLGTADDNKLIRFDLEKETFTLIKLPTDLHYFHVTKVEYDPAGFLWVVCRDGLFRYYPEEDSLFHVPFAEPDFQKESNDLASVTIDTAGGVWVTDYYMHIYQWDREKDLLVPQFALNEKIPDSFAHAYRVSMDPLGNLWMLGSETELMKLNPYEKTIEVIQPMEPCRSIDTDGGMTVDSQGNIWYGMGHGLVFYDPFTGVATPLENPNGPQIITDVEEDYHGNILVASSDGLWVVDRRASSIRHHDAAKELVNEAGAGINSVVRDGQTLWIGSLTAGLLRYNPGTGQIIKYQEGEQAGMLRPGGVFSVLKDRDNRIWVLSGIYHLQRYNEQTNSFEQAPLQARVFFTQDQNGFFWSCHNSFVTRFDPVSFDTIPVTFNQPLAPLRGKYDWQACEMDRSGILWVGGVHGLNRIDPLTGEWNNFHFQKGNPFSLPNDEVFSICCDSKERVWAGSTLGLHQIYWHPETDSFSCRDILYEGRDFGWVLEILEDSQGNIWATTESGTYIMDPSGKVTREFSGWNRLLVMDPDGSIYTGNDEFMEIPPGYLDPNEHIPPILITEFSINNKWITPGKGSPLDKSILFADRIDLDHDQNFFRLDFAALNYEHPERNRYRYILEGVDSDTVNAGNRSFAEYTDLAPGKYRFWVTGSNNTGLWNSLGTSLIIRIHPPWYLTTASLVSYVLLILLLIYGYIRFRTSRLRNEKVYLETEVLKRTEEIRQKNSQILELDNQKTRFFANISHEFRTLVTLVKAPAENIMETEKISLEGRRGVEMIYRNANRLMRLVTQLLDISKIDRKKMKLVLCEENIFDFAHSIAVSFSSLAEVKGIQYRYYLPRTDAKEWFDADKLEKIINNLLSNAFKFTDEGGKVRLDMVHRNQGNGNENLMEITISDTGKGIPEEEQTKIFDRFYQTEMNLKKDGSGTGIGLAHAHELVDLMHGSIEVNSAVGKGSAFTVRIPVGIDHLNENEYTISESGWKVQERVPDEWKTPASEKELIHSRKGKNQEEKKPRLLVVDDNDDILWLLSDKLGSEFDVMEAVDGSAGLKLATENMPDLVITDLMMPRMDGVELCKKLKTDLRTSHIPVIMLTAKAAPEDKLAGLETGADDYITKPFEIREVLVRSRNLVTQRRKLREKFSSEIILNPREIVITSTDEKFLTRAMDVIDRHMSNEKFDVSTLCEEMNMSHSTLFRKLDALTDQSPVEFIRTLRLKRAAVLLKEQYGNVSEVALEVGFSNPSYFSRMFKKTFAISPAEFSKLNLQNP